MKKISILLILIILTACEKESDNDCKCKGKFGHVAKTGAFYGYGVDCYTGEPALSQQEIGTYFMGCVD